jgi:16S rRNA pseudouridine516 synthase
MSQAVRLDRLLANLGYGSRREVDAMIRGGRVTLDGAGLLASDCKIAAADAPRLQVESEPLDPMPGLVLMMHKPVGTICSHDEAGPLVHDLLPARWRRRDPPLSSAGRLDKDTSGLLLLTDDGALLHKIISPKTHLPKRYRATLARPLTGTEAALFAAGTLMLKGESKPLRPARLDVLTPTAAMLTIEEGRYHQVRRMFAAVGNHVEALHRESVGGLALPETCALGTFTILAPPDVQAIFAIA